MTLAVFASVFAFAFVAFAAGLAAQPEPPSSHHWVFQTSEQHKYVHMSTVEALPDGRIAVAFQSAQGEGNDEQAIFYKLSSDGGVTWEPHKVAVKSGFSQAVWGPALVYNHHAPDGAHLMLFFSASVPQNVRAQGRSWPGGDIYVQRSTDMGDTWGAPVRLLGYVSATRGNISKVTANKPVVSSDGKTWVLPFWQEQHVASDTGPSCAGVLVSGDFGATFQETKAFLHSDTAGWLIENTIAEAVNGSLVQLFRTENGYIWQSLSDDWGYSWTTPQQTPLLNPNSKVYISRAPTNSQLMTTFNPSKVARTPLQLSLSEDSSATWQSYTILDTDRSVAYPTTTYYQPGNGTPTNASWQILTTYSASTTDGIRIAITPLE